MLPSPSPFPFPLPPSLSPFPLPSSVFPLPPSLFRLPSSRTEYFPFIFSNTLFNHSFHLCNGDLFPLCGNFLLSAWWGCVIGAVRDGRSSQALSQSVLIKPKTCISITFNVLSKWGGAAGNTWHYSGATLPPSGDEFVVRLNRSTGKGRHPVYHRGTIGWRNAS